MKHILFLVVPPIIELGLFGALNVFALAGATTPKPVAREQRKYRTTIATAGNDLLVEGECGTQLIADKHYSQVDSHVDTLVVVGGDGALHFGGDPRLCAWLRETSHSARRMGSICTGSFVLAAAGLLDGRRVATHQDCTADLANRYPDIHVDPDSVCIKDGPFYSSSGITAGVDLALSLVREDIGNEAAMNIARQLVVFPKRPGAMRKFSVALDATSRKNENLASLLAWVAGNLDQNLAIEALAARMAMSPRNFARVFREEIGTTPARYVRDARFEAACRLLEQTRRGLDEIAASCGFGDDEIMRRVFVERLGVPPGRYRESFQATPLEHC